MIWLVAIWAVPQAALLLYGTWRELRRERLMRDAERRMSERFASEAFYAINAQRTNPRRVGR